MFIICYLLKLVCWDNDKATNACHCFALLFFRGGVKDWQNQG
ncbi:hypothetical protein [Moraxella lacunata]